MDGRHSLPIHELVTSVRHTYQHVSSRLDSSSFATRYVLWQGGSRGIGWIHRRLPQRRWRTTGLEEGLEGRPGQDIPMAVGQTPRVPLSYRYPMAYLSVIALF
jgi:hypothetical protein